MSIRKGDSIIAGMPNDLLASKADNVAFTGATSLSSGIMGLVPAPTSNEQYSFLCGDGTWSDPFVPDLFDFKWSDHELNNMSWVRADTFSWQDGTVYSNAYQHLVDDISGKTLQTETGGGATVSFYLADDGHKICPADQETNIATVYGSRGVAWFYILDTANQRFKLPRTKFGLTGLRDGVGNYVGAGLPNITGYFNSDMNGSAWLGFFANGVFYGTNQPSNGGKAASTSAMSGSRYSTVNFDASRSSAIYGASTTVQPPATQMYLYFYVGQFTQTALQNTAGLNAELFNEKADLDIFDLLYPVGAVYIGVQSTCPLASIIPGSTWSKIEGRYLLASGTIAGTSEYASPNTYISAGLPNIAGSIDIASDRTNQGGALYWTNNKTGTNGGGAGGQWIAGFSAQNSNSVYGNSATVRPTAYAVNVWVRTA